MAYGVKIFEIMGRHPLVVSATATVYSALGKMLKSKSGFVLVVDKSKNLIGMLTEGTLLKDVLYKCKDPKKLKVKDVMIRKIITISPEKDINEAMKMFEKKKIRKLPVVDGSGKLVGVVTVEMIANVDKGLMDVMIEKLKMLKPSFRIGGK